MIMSTLTLPSNTVSINLTNNIHNSTSRIINNESERQMNENINKYFEYDSNVFGVFEGVSKTMDEIKKQLKTYYHICLEGKIINLLKPVTFLVEYNDDGIYFTNRELNIFSCGDNFELAEQDMYEEFEIQWDVFAKKDDSQLTSNALKIKNTLLESIKL